KRSEGRLNLLELGDPAGRPHDLNPAAVGPGCDAVHFVEGVVAVLRLPEEAGDRIEGEAEAVAPAIREDLLDVVADVAADPCAHLEKRIVAWSSAVGIKPEDYSRVVRVVGLRAAELIVGLPRAERAVAQVLGLTAAALVADLEIELAVGAKKDLAAVV